MCRYCKNIPSGERGVILIGLLVTMVIFAVLGAALVPITATSTFNQIGANNAMRAYYLAEAGYRLAGSQFLHAGDGYTGFAQETNRDLKLAALHNQTYTLANNYGTFHLESYPWYLKTAAATPGNSNSLPTTVMGALSPQITIPSSGKILVNTTVYDYASVSVTGATVTFVKSSGNWPAGIPANTTVLPVGVASATTLTRGGNLTLSSGIGAFPPYRGTFQLNAGGNVYSYWRKVGSELQNVTIYSDPFANFSVNVAGGTNVALLKYLELHVTATLGSGIMLTNREIIYRGPIAAVAPDQGGSSGVPEGQQESIPDLTTMADASGAVSQGEFTTVTLGEGDKALNVTKTTQGNESGNQPSTEAYVSVPSGTSNPFYQSWNGSGNYLSYDVQVKVATGAGPNGEGWNGTSFEEATKPTTYSAGIIFRSTTVSTQSTFYGFSFMRTTAGSGNDTDGIQDTMIPPVVTSAAAWSRTHGAYNVGDQVTYTDGYTYKCILAHDSGNSKKPDNSTYWQPLNAGKAMVALWTRNGNQANGDDNWLAYKLLDETGGNDYVVSTAGKLKDWSTVMVRVAEAASLKLTVSSAPDISIGETVTGGTGTAVIYNKINDSDGNVVLLLNNVEGTFTRPAQVATYNTDATWGYRSRDNYIWAFFTDKSDHSADTTPTNNVRLGQDRGTLNWSTTDIGGWAAADDKFTLVQWSSSLNTAQDSMLRLMGSGNEANAIIRTQKWITGAYNEASFPPELGVVSVGSTSVRTYFDDLGYYLRGAGDGSTPGGTGFLPPVQQ